MLASLIDFCNIKSWKQETIFAYCDKHIWEPPRMTEDSAFRLERSQDDYRQLLYLQQAQTEMVQ